MRSDGCAVERSGSPPRLIAMTHMRRLALFAFVPVLVAAAACSGAASAGGGAAGGALAVCREELPGHDVVSGTWTTVGALRSWESGGPIARQPLAHVFPKASAADQAAWCWTKNAPHVYTMWGARAHDGSQLVGKMTEGGGQADTPPSGVVQPP